MIIEFIAVPGSGKTYLSDKLYTYLKKEMSNKGIVLFNRADINEIKREKASTQRKNITRVNIILNYIKVIDIYLLRCIINLFLSPNYSYKVKFQLTMYLLDIFLNYKIIDDLKKEYKNKCVFILDEGVLHASSICMKECTPENIKIFFKRLKGTKWIKNKQLFVFIDCDTDIIYNRLTKRPDGWPNNWKDLSDKKKEIELKNSYLKFEAKKEYIFKKKKKRNYFVINNNEYFNNDPLFYKKIIKKINKLERDFIR